MRPITQAKRAKRASWSSSTAPATTNGRSFERAAAKCPDDEALGDAQHTYTFAQLARAVEGAAALMARAGVAPGVRVAASLGNECNLVIAFFANLLVRPVHEKHHVEQTHPEMAPAE